MLVTTQIKCGTTPDKDFCDHIIRIMNEHAGSMGPVKKLSISRTSNWITVYIEVPESFRRCRNKVKAHKLFICHFIMGILAWNGEDVR